MKLSAILIVSAFGIALTLAEDCGLEVPPLDIFDYQRWSGVFRYTLYQGTYPDSGAADCQMKYWAWVDGTTGDFNMNKTYRYFDGSTDITDSFTGYATLEADEGAAHWILTLSQGDEYHISMVETDYETYAAYIECDETSNKNFPVISSTTKELDQETVDRLTLRFIELGANMDGFTQVVHDENCLYTNI